MADPTITSLATGQGSTATTTISFTGQAVGTLLVLSYIGDDYHTTSGANRPESSGFTLERGVGTGSGSFHGAAVWWKVADGSETSVSYTIGSASRSAYKLVAADSIDTGSPVDISAIQNVNSSSQSYTTPSVSTTTGRRLAVGVMGFSLSSATIPSVGTWLNSYVDQGEGLTTATPGLATGHGTAIFDGGGSTSTGATVGGGVTPQARSGIIVVFKVATGGGAPALPPPLIMQTRRAF